MLRRHDRSQFHLTLYSGVQAEDEVTQRCRALADEWVPVAESLGLIDFADVVEVQKRHRDGRYGDERWREERAYRVAYGDHHPDHIGHYEDEPDRRSFWERAGEQFDAELLTDLALSCAMWLGMGRMLRTLDIGQTCKITL